jgi:hypothetical protein
MEAKRSPQCMFRRLGRGGVAVLSVPPSRVRKDAPPRDSPQTGTRPPQGMIASEPSDGTSRDHKKKPVSFCDRIPSSRIAIPVVARMANILMGR